MVSNPFIIKTTQYTCEFHFLLIVISVLSILPSVNKYMFEIKIYFMYSWIDQVVNIPLYALNEKVINKIVRKVMKLEIFL